jgi:hypothetical protein
LRGPNGEDDVYADKKNVNSERNDATSIKKQSKGKNQFQNGYIFPLLNVELPQIGVSKAQGKPCGADHLT